MATLADEVSESAVGEVTWARHVLRLHDERGELQVHVTPALAASRWLELVGLVALRAWAGEDETEVAFFAEGRRLAWDAAALKQAP